MLPSLLLFALLIFPVYLKHFVEKLKNIRIPQAKIKKLNVSDYNKGSKEFKRDVNSYSRLQASFFLQRTRRDISPWSACFYSFYYVFLTSI